MSWKRGFTLVELLVVVSIVAIVALVGFPSLQKLIVRSRLEGVTRETAVIMNFARQEAIKSKVPVVMSPLFDEKEILVFADVDGDGTFDPEAAPPVGPADYQVARIPLPTPAAVSAAIEFMGPSGRPATSSDPGDSVSGFAATGGLAVFEPNGSARSEGAYRFGDHLGNVLEVRVGPRTLGRVQVRKFNPEPPGELPPDFYAPGSYRGQPLWVWYYRTSPVAPRFVPP